MRANTSCIRRACIYHLYIPVPSLEDCCVFLRQQLEYRLHGRHRFVCPAYTEEYATQTGTTVDCSTAELRRNAVKNIALKAHGYCTPNTTECNAYGLYTKGPFRAPGQGVYCTYASRVGATGARVRHRRGGARSRTCESHGRGFGSACCGPFRSRYILTFHGPNRNARTFAGL